MRLPNLKNRWKGLLLFFAVAGPGIITSNVDNDAGGIATYSIAGSHFGNGLLWSLIPIMLALIVVQEMSARMGVVTGKGLSDLIRERFGVKVTVYVLIGVVAVTNPQVTPSGPASVLFYLGVYVLTNIAASAAWRWCRPRPARWRRGWPH